MLTTEFLQFHPLSIFFFFISAIISPDFLSVSGWNERIPKSFSSFMSPTMRVRRSLETFGFESDDISFESKCTAVSFWSDPLFPARSHYCLCNLAPWSVRCWVWCRNVRQFYSSFCDKGCCVCLMHVANATSLGHSTMSWGMKAIVSEQTVRWWFHGALTKVVEAVAISA